MFSFLFRKKMSRGAAQAQSNVHFLPATKRQLVPAQLETCRRAALRALDAIRSEESDYQENAENMQECYRQFLRTDSCTQSFCFQMGGADKKPLSISQWGDLARGTTLENALTLLDALNSGAAIEEGLCTVIVPDIVLAGMDLSDPTNLGLPAREGESIHLTPRGVEYTDDFSVQVEFISNTRRLVHPTRKGLLLESGGRKRLLPSELFIIAQTLNEFAINSKAAVNTEERRLAWAKARSILDLSPIACEALRKPSRSRILTVESLSVQPDRKGHLQPILLAPRNVQNSPDDYTPVLNTEEQKQLGRYLDGDLPLHGHIPLGSRSYVFIDKRTTSVLTAIRKLNHSSPQERLAFMANPQKALLQYLEQDVAVNQTDIEEIVNHVFIETKDFQSERIKCLGPWEPKSLSFAKPISNQWFEDGEDRYGITLAGQPYWATAQEIRQLIKDTKKAQKEGRDEITFNNIPINSEDISFENLQAVLAKSQVKHTKDQEPEVADDSNSLRRQPTAPETPEMRLAPQIKDNIYSLEYAVTQVKRIPWSHELNGIDALLMPHQQECLAWLQKLWNQGMKGALLADDMGLGKTLQCLAFLSWVNEGLQKEDDQGLFLVVSPVGLLKNWSEEGKKWASRVLGAPMSLTARQIRALQSMTSVERGEYLNGVSWCLTTYETIRNHLDFFLKEQWTIVVLDEAQKIKNPTSLTTECVKSIKSLFTLAMTGTPVENSFMDLWCIMDAAIPGVFGSLKDFHQRWCDKERVYECGKGLHDLLTGKSPSASEQTGEQPPCLMLRRMKTDKLKELPQKLSQSYPQLMPTRQQEAYESILEQRRSETKERVGNTALVLLMQLANTCLSPDAITQNKEELITPQIISDSARLEALFRILDEIKKRQEKAIIFVLHLELQRKLAIAIRDYYGLDHLPGMISGSMTADRRQSVVNSFQHRPANQFDVAILMARAAGTGLTLTAANHVIHLERWWNPAVEDQCSDRCWRIGQRKDVIVHYPLAMLNDRNKTSFDAKLDQFLEKKRQLSRNVLLPNQPDSLAEDLLESVLAE